MNRVGLIQGIVATGVALAVSAGMANAQHLSKTELNNKEAAKNANVAEAQKLNGDLPTQKQKKSAAETANVVNQVPGVKVSAKDLEPPALPPIKGFHPIKKLLRPVENLEGMTIKLEQQIMRLEGPISALQPPMIGLQKKMTGVDERLGAMHTQLDSTQKEVTGVRSDIAAMRKDIQELKQPIVSLQKPVAGVAKPLEDVETKLNLVIMTIILAAVAISIGTPLAAIILYKYRDKLFPGVSKDMPKVVKTEPAATRR